jgi:hypothetical protein
MNVWQIKNDLMNKVAVLVVAGEDGRLPAFWEPFQGAGRPVQWSGRPKLVVFKDKRSKKPKPRADISPFTADGLVWSSKAHETLGDFLSQFGQLLELDVEENVEYYFNVTHVVPCVDQDRSERRASGAISKPAFIDSSIPTDASVFVDPTKPADIYVNDEARNELGRRIKQAGITGMSFVQVWGEPAVSAAV